MLKTAARILLLRVLPRRILPIVTVIEALLFLRGLRRNRRVQVNDPVRSRTAAPAPLETVAPVTGPATTPPPLAR